MVEPLPKWIMRAYSKLWVKFKNKEFNHDEASKTLKEDKMVSVILSEMKKAGWLEIKLDPTDSRRRLYKLISPEEAVKEIARR
jgi:DNA-binding MarR family transcriptional regulator